MKIDQLAGLQPVAGVTYSVQVRPDNKSTWDTIAVSRPTPEVDVDRNQFAGANRAEVRVLRTTGFDEVIAEDTVDFKYPRGYPKHRSIDSRPSGSIS